MKKKSVHLTPLQQEAKRIADEKQRRQDALKAAQQWALRGALQKKPASSSSDSGTAPLPDDVPLPPDFDVMRAALRDERHRDARGGINPRHVSATDDEFRDHNDT